MIGLAGGAELVERARLRGRERAREMLGRDCCARRECLRGMGDLGIKTGGEEAMGG